jgi:hypothetical protein
MERQKAAEQPETQEKVHAAAAGNRQKDTKRINPRVLRELEADIFSLEEALAATAKKLEHPLEISESVEVLGKEYVELQAKLDAKWQAWNALFED